MTALRTVFGRFMHGNYAGRTVVAFCLALVALIWAGIAAEVVRDRERAIAREMEENAVLVRVLEDTVERVLKNADQVLLMVKHRYEREGRGFDLAQYASDGVLQTQPYTMISIADGQGRITQFSRPSAPVNIADREHFQVHAQRDSGRLHVGKPALGRTTGRWTLYLTRRINRADGTFGGVAVVGLDMDYLTHIFRRADLGPRSTITVIGLDGIIRARQSDTNDTPGQDVSDVPLLTQRVPASDRGNYSDVSKVDGVTRVFSYRVMRDFPLVMLVGTAQATALAGARRRMVALTWGGSLASAAILLFAVLFLAQSRRQGRNQLVAREELEQQVRQRTARLEKANKELEAFVYSVSHDLRTPLRAISGFSQILARRQRDRLDEQGRHYLDNVVEASAHMGRLIDDLLTYSRLGRQAVRLAPVALAGVFDKIARHLQPRIAELAAEVRFPVDPPRVMGEEVLLYQIFLNLVDNALTYHKPSEPPVVEISCRLHADSISVCVRDQGIGIDPEHFETIFGVFQRLHRQDDFPGTGIGLATVRRSADLIDAEVRVESAPGAGSAFVVTLTRTNDD